LCFFGPTFYSDFGWVQPAGHRLEEGTRQLRAGVGKLLIGSERELAPIVVLYSYPSQLTSVASRYWSGWQGTEGLWDAAVESRLVLEKMLLGSGVSFGYQTDTQIAGGTLRGAKLLIIPWHMGLALSNATVRAIERFVRDGGTLLAELPPAQADEHGKRLARGALDELFGVRSSQSAPRHSARDYGALVRGTDGLAPQGEWFVDEWYDARLQVTTGKAAGVHLADNAPAFVVKRTGRGQALLVNMLFASLKVGQSTASGEQYALMRSVLSAAQVAPLAELTSRADPNPSCCEVNRFRGHDNQYYGVFAHTQPSAQPLVVRFADTRDTYDVRAGRYLGRVQETELSLRAGDAVLLARLDYKLAGLQLIARPAVRGEPVVVAVQLAASRTPGRHIVHVQVTDPKGMARPLYTQNVVIRGGQGELSFLPALNEPAGDWRIEAREVVSGLSAQCSVRLP
jgi:hypothetical protein